MKRSDKFRSDSRDSQVRAPREFVREKHFLLLLRQYLAEPQLYQADKWLTNYFKSEKNYGKQDRAWYSNNFYMALRLSPAILYHRKIPFSEPAEFLRILADEIAKDFISDLNTHLRELENSPENHLEYGIPPWWNFSENTVSLPSEKILPFLKRSVTQPPLWLRVNHGQATSRVIAELEEGGFTVEQKVQGNTVSLHVQGEKGIFTFPFFKEGLTEIQDYASQCIGIAADAHPGMLVWDACAGGGGKTMQLAAHLKNKGVIIASDVRAYKLEDVKARARRAKFHNIRILPWDGIDLPDFPLEIKKRGGFHRVLVDAPCSASGTLRRNPDVRFRTGYAQAIELRALQSQILRATAPTVLVGGKLIYATCSIFKVENEEAAQEFLSQHPNFSLESMKLHGSPETDSDTMFTAVFVREH